MWWTRGRAGGTTYFRLALEGLSCRQIAAQLNAEGIPSPGCYAGLYPSGTGQWSGERISEMLQNETYIGNMVQGRRRKVSYKSKSAFGSYRRTGWWWREPMEPLVTPETFERVGRLLPAGGTPAAEPMSFH
ncbi:MAG: recombinase family protein [Flavonifractor plautii]